MNNQERHDSAFSTPRESTEADASLEGYTNDEIQQVIDHLDAAQGFFPDNGSWQRGIDIRRSLSIASEILTEYPGDVNTELLAQLVAAHDALDALCLAGHMHLVSAALPKGHGLDSMRAAVWKATGGARPQTSEATIRDAK